MLVWNCQNLDTLIERKLLSLSEKTSRNDCAMWTWDIRGKCNFYPFYALLIEAVSPGHCHNAHRLFRPLLLHLEFMVSASWRGIQQETPPFSACFDMKNNLVLLPMFYNTHFHKPTFLQNSHFWMLRNFLELQFRLFFFLFSDTWELPSLTTKSLANDN